MTKKTVAEVHTTVGRETLDETPGRVLKLLRGIGLCIPIRVAMASKGYGDADHAEGWHLLGQASGYRSEGLDPAIDASVRDAIRYLDSWDEDGFRIVRASLTRRHPAQAKFVLAGIGPSTGPAAVVGVETLLDRIDALAKSKNKEDHAALATLASRGINEAERKRLRALLKSAKSAPSASAPANRGDADIQHQKNLVSLRGWYEEWSEIARVAVKRRDYLILLGLAKRKLSNKKTSGTSPASSASASGAPATTPNASA